VLQTNGCVVVNVLKIFFVCDAREKKYCVVIFFLSFGLVYKYVRKTVVQHKTIKRINFVVWKQSGFFITFSLNQDTRTPYKTHYKVI
jgi:hypothetical protein